MTAKSTLGKHATSLALIAAAVGIGAYAYFVDRDTISDNERRRRDNDVIPAYRREEVDHVEVTRPGTQPLVLERSRGTDGGDPAWAMTSPRKGQADQSAVERLLSAFEFASIVRKVNPKDAVGLDAPRATGKLGMGRLVYRFALGGAAPVPEGSGYLRIDGQGTYVVTRELVQALTDDSSVYRERTIVPYLSLDLSALMIQSKVGTVSLARMDATSFLLTDTKLRASRDRLDRIWSALAEMRAEAFVDDATADRATAPAAFAIKMTPTDKTKTTGAIDVGGPCPDHPDDLVVVRRAPTRVSACAPKGIADGLATTAESLVDTRLFAAHSDEVEELRIEGVGEDHRRLEVARKGNGWHERAPRDRELEGDEVDAANALADALTHAEGSDVRPSDPGAPFSGRAKITITRAEQGGDEVVVLGPQEGESTPVQRTADGALLRVPQETAKLLLPTELGIRSRILFEPKADQRVPTRIRTRCDDVAQELSRSEGEWSMQATVPREALPPDVPGALDLAAAVGRAKAESWVADADDPAFGFAGGLPCTLSLVYEDDAGPREVSLEFGKDAPGGVYARESGQATVFVASKSLRALASHWLVDRSGFKVDPASLASVTLTKGKKTLVLVRRGQTLGAVDGGGDEQAAKVADALASMRAEAAIHVGPPQKDEGFPAAVLDVRVRLSSDAAAGPHFVIGHATLWNEQRVYFARLDGVDATFVLAEARLSPLLDAL